MVIVELYAVAVVLCVITMLCRGSWANTQKLPAAVRCANAAAAISVTRLGAQPSAPTRREIERFLTS